MGTGGEGGEEGAGTGRVTDEETSLRLALSFSRPHDLSLPLGQGRLAVK